MLTFDCRSHPIANRFDEVKEVATSAINAQILSGVNMVNTTMGMQKSSVDGDLKSSFNVSTKLVDTPITGQENLLNDNLEKSILSALDFGYTNAITDAANIVQSRHPEDTL